MVDHLPRDSAYGDMVATDEEMAAAAPDSPRRDWRPRVREWSSEVELLAAIHDRLNDVVQVQHEKNLNLKPWPRPVTASELLRQRESQRRRARVRELFKPREGGA